MNANNTNGPEVLGPNDGKWLGEYSQVHMNVFGTPLRVMITAKAPMYGTWTATAILISWPASPSFRWAMRTLHGSRP